MALNDLSPRLSPFTNRFSNGHGLQSYRGGQTHWSQYSYVQLIISGLPFGVNTFDIYQNFKEYGNVSKISIFDRRQDDRGTRAELYFEPPPKEPIWEHGRANFESPNGLTIYVTLKLSKYQPKSFKVESPIHRGVMYNEKTELVASSLTWGFRVGPEKMITMEHVETTVTTMQDVRTTEHVRLVLNLYKREIEVFFPFFQSSENRDAVRSFRFAIALDESFTLWRLSSGQYVLHLSGIPWYSKRLKEAIEQTHNPNTKRWAEEDTWARQTDIFKYKGNFRLINETPISLQKNLNTINIARWTTFLIHLVDSNENKVAEKTFLNALKDFNVNVFNGANFQIEEGSPQLETQAWETLNEQSLNRQTLSLAEELSALRLSFPVRYQLEVCLSHGWLSEYQVTTEFLQRLAGIEIEKAKQMLIYVDSYQERIWNVMEIFKDLRFRRPVKKRPLPEHCIEIQSATITATTILWNTPTVEITNRVIRRHKHHADCFLRVRFEDDMYRGQTRLYASSNNKMILLFQRVRRALTHGIRLGDRHYEFLAWGNSQLREHGAYFFAQVDRLTAAEVRAEMGAFDQEKVVAKRAARMGQCFSTTKPVHLRLPTITPNNTIPDLQQGRYCFTDGVGKISPLAAQIVHQQLKIKGPVPSTFQFRLGGCKGVLTVWPDLVGVDVQVRPSQFKFNSTSGDLEIIRWSEFWQPFLNRQIILCLSALGVSTETFMKKQEETIQAIDAAMKDDKAAVKALRDNVDPNLMTPSMVYLIEAGFRASREPFVMSILYLWKAWSLKYLKEKAKIPVPQGAFVLGCVDETNTLRGHFEKLSPHPEATTADKIKTLPEIFIQVTDPQTNKRKIIEGLCVLARNPSLHRGDIRIVKAINVPKLKHLCDVVVMPANGDRDLPSMCSGGDLDGDDYMVIWDQELIPPTWNVEPFHYDPPSPRTAVGEITTIDMIDFFYNYLQNDYLGRIAHAHLAAADFLDDGLESQTCLELVHLHSMAVDYPKTGVPAIMERRLERNTWPHFMEKKGPRYQSHKVLGKLYDAVERISFKPVYDLPFDRRLLNAHLPTEEMMRSIQDLKQDYDNAVQRIMAQHKIQTEFEVFSTFVLSHSKASRDYKFHEEIGNLSSALKEQYHEALCEIAGGKDFEHLAPVAVAAYQYTNAMVQTALNEIKQGLRYDGTEGMPFISFPWVLKDTLCQIARISNDLIAVPGSSAIVRNGEVVTVNDITEFDDEGRAQIKVRDALDASVGYITGYSGHLPDPYQPDANDSKLEGSLSQISIDLDSANHITKNGVDMSNSQTESTEETTANTNDTNRQATNVSVQTDSVDSLHENLIKKGKVEIDDEVELRSVRGSNVRITVSLEKPERTPPPGTSCEAPVNDEQETDTRRSCQNKASENTVVSSALMDPLNMTAEELEAFGLPADMEI